MKSLIVSTERGLENAKRIVDLNQELTDRREALERELNEKYAEIQREILAEVESAWSAILEEQHIPQAERELWYVIGDFLRDHGIAFLVYDEDRATQYALLQSRIMPAREKH